MPELPKYSITQRQENVVVDGKTGDMVTVLIKCSKVEECHKEEQQYFVANNEDEHVVLSKAVWLLEDAFHGQLQDDGAIADPQEVVAMNKEDLPQEP